MDDEIRGYDPDIILIDATGDFSSLEIKAAAYMATTSGKAMAIHALYVTYFGNSGQRLADILDVDSIRMEAEPEAYDIRDWEPLPRPLRAPLKIKQAPKQSLRKTMRSVNRNR